MKNKAQTTFFSVLAMCFVVLVVVYMYVYQPKVEDTEALRISNQTLSNRITELKNFHAKMPEYQEQIQLMTEDVHKILEGFPADVKEEDSIWLAVRTLYEDIEVHYRSVGISEREHIATIPAQLVQGAAIEGLTEDIIFNQRLTSYSTVNSYSNLKELVTTINNNQEELAITNVAYSMNEEGLLEGSIDATFYMVGGTGKEYVPREFKDYKTGLENLFGGVK